MNLFPCRPVLREIVELALNLVLQFSVSVETDGTGDCKVVVEQCGNAQHSTPLRVLGRSGTHNSTERG